MVIVFRIKNRGIYEMDHKMNDKKRADYRIERDSIGAKDVPKDVPKAVAYLTESA